MRTAFIKTLSEIAEEDKDVFLLTGDLGFSVFEDFEKRFGERFINMGISEQNMTGVAAGLALTNKKVFTYSIIPFVTMRCFEQIRNDICYQNLNVKIIGVGAGLSYGSAGMTHQAIEDVSILRTLPNMTVICPGDPIETSKAVRQSMNLSGPCYIRLGKKGEPNLHDPNVNYQIGKGIIMREGKDLALITCGNMLETCNEVAKELEKQNLSTRVISMHTVKPIDKELIYDTLKNNKYIFSIEEHSVIGGLGSAIAEVLSEAKIKKDFYFKRIGIMDQYSHFTGSQNYLRSKLGLDKEGIIRKIKEIKR